MVEKALWGRKVNLAVPTPETFPTDDEIDKMEALLPGCKHGWLESNDVALHYRKFEPTKKKSRAVVVFMHGISAQSGKGIVLQSSGRKLAMSLLSDELMKAGYTLYALDMRGHGYSEGTRFYVPTWETNRDDLDALVHLASNEHPDEPLFLMGESYGATLCLHLARKWQTMSGAPDKFSGLALIAPAIIGDVPPWPITYTLRYLLAPLAPKWTPFFMPVSLAVDHCDDCGNVRISLVSH
jgi:alpha-beta hydrolase superfamily lysophospholipase